MSAASDDFSTINFSWEDESRELIIGERSGNGFEGMLKSRTFEIFVVSAGHGVGVAPASGADKIVTYDGSAVKVHL